jgi:hypothetical protein
MVVNKLFVFLFISILLVSSVSATNFDNIKKDISFDKDSKLKIGDKDIDYNPIWEKYKPIKIDNWFGIGKTLFEGAIDEHTETCVENCLSTIDINLANDGSLIDDIKFIGDINSYQLYIATSENDVVVNDHELQCVKNGRAYVNGSKGELCSEVNIGSHIEKEYTWEKYNLGDSVTAGNHKIKLEGSKDKYEIVDWIIKTNGEWVEEWAIWGSISTEEAIFFSGSNSTTATLNSLGGQLGAAYNITSLHNKTVSNVSAYLLVGSAVSNMNRSVGIFTNNAGAPGTLIGGWSESREMVSTNGNVTWTFNSADRPSVASGVNYWIVFNLTSNGAPTGFFRFGENVSTPIQYYTTADWTTWTIFGGDVGAMNIKLWSTGEDGAVTLNSPTDNILSNTQKNLFNGSAVITGGSTLVNISLMTNQSGTFKVVNTTTITGISNESTFNHSFTVDGNYLWNIQVCDSDGDCGTGAVNRTVTIDTTAPIISFTSPSATIDYHKFGNNLSLNWTLTELNKDSCWFNYNSLNTTVNCLAGNYSFTPVSGFKNITFYANDTINNIGSNTTSWYYSVLENNITFNNDTNEGNSETFTINLDVNDSISITEAILVYNNTNYTSSINFSGGNYLISSIVSVPLVATNTNMSFWFIFSYDSQQSISTINNQSVSNLQFSSCGGVSSDVLLNVSLVDEVLRTNLVGDIQIGASIISKSSGEIVETISDEFSSVTSGAICFSPVASYNLYYLDAEVRYSATGYASEFYIIQKADLADYPLNMTLFDLNSSASTEFLLKYQDDNLIAVESAVIQLLRRYIQNNTYETVEAPLTSNTGTAVVHVDLDTNKYKAIVVKEGVVLDIFTNIVFDCESELSGQCTQNLFGAINPQNSVTNDVLNDLTYTITTVNNTVTTTFSIPSGTPSTVNIELLQLDTFGESTLCNQTIFSSAGSIDCTFNATIGDSMVYLEISKNNVLEAQQSYFIAESGGIDWLDNNFFIVLLLLLSLTGMAISSPEWMIINGILTLVISSGLWLLNGLNFVVGLGGLIWIIIAGGILIFKLTKQEDR